MANWGNTQTWGQTWNSTDSMTSSGNTATETWYRRLQGPTYAIGKVFVKHFESDGDLLSLDMEKAKASVSKVFKRKKEELEEPTPKAKGAKK